MNQSASKPEASPSNETGSENTGADSAGLERSLGYWDNVFLGAGAIVGAGIYAIIGEAAGLAGSMLWLSLAIAAFSALLCACCYGELVSRFPDSGGGYEYIAQGFGRTTANYMSVIVVLTGIVSPAAIAIAFGEYLSQLVDVPVGWSATGVIVLMAVVNIFGSKESSVVNTVATLITIVGLLAVVGFCVPHWGEMSLMETTEAGIAGVFGGAAMAFFSYVGFEDVVKMAEETRKPKKVVPWALVTAGGFAMVMYVIVAVSAMSVIEWKDLAESDGPLNAVMETTWGPVGGIFITVIALFATSKSILANIMGNSRLVFDLSRDTRLPKFFGYLIPKFQTPVVAIVLIGIVTWLFTLIGDLGTIASISNVLVLTLFLMVCASLVLVRRNHKGEKPRFHLPFNVAGVSIINIGALVMLTVMFAFNIYNLVTA